MRWWGARSKPRTTLRIKIGLARSGGGVLVPSQGGLGAASGTNGVEASLIFKAFLTAGLGASEVEPQALGAHAGEA